MGNVFPSADLVGCGTYAEYADAVFSAGNCETEEQPRTNFSKNRMGL